MSSAHSLHSRPLPKAVILACSLLLLVTGSAGAQSLRAAAKARTKADHALVAAAKSLRSCRRNCAHKRRALQRAGIRLSRADHRVSSLARRRRKRRADHAASVRRAPYLTVSGQTLTWNRVRGVSSYVLVRKVPGQSPQYSVTSVTQVTPPPVPGATVAYAVRTNVSGSSWSAQRSISYPAPPPPPAPAPVVDTKAAPTLHVSGQTLSWNQIGNVTAYVLVAKVAGKADQYTKVSGTSVTPAAQPGATVQYSVRTAVDGSAWSVPVSIAYPAPPAPPSGGGSSGSPSGAFEMGVVSGSAPSYELSFINQAGARTARVEFGIDTPASQLESIFAAFAAKGIRILPLASFNGGLPTVADAQNLGRWAAEFGPGGTFWQGKSYPAGTAMTEIEFGNETSYSWQYSDNSSTAYANRAQTYALRFKDAVTAVRAANPSVGILAQGDPGNAPGTSWMDNMFRAVPNLGQLVAGWTVHPYGPNWKTIMDKLVNSAQADGAPSSIPLWVTEYGLATDNGRCLDDNYGWSKCMTYDQAASTLTSVIDGMRQAYGSRIAHFYLFQAHDRQASGSSSSRENYFGVLQSNAATKGSYTSTVTALLAANP